MKDDAAKRIKSLYVEYMTLRKKNKTYELELNITIDAKQK